MFSGSMVALVTPFKDGKIDWQSLEALVEFHIKNGTNGIVPVGRRVNRRRLTIRSTTRLFRP